MEFVFVKGGCYQMGDTFGDGQINEKPVHEVCVNDFWIGKYEVTQGEYRKLMGSNPSKFKNGDRYPVETVSWNDSRSYARQLSAKSNKSFRLPTEAEWEYAARERGKGVRFGNGQNHISPDTANFDGNSDYKKSYFSAGIYREKTTKWGASHRAVSVSMICPVMCGSGVLTGTVKITIHLVPVIIRRDLHLAFPQGNK